MRWERERGLYEFVYWREGTGFGWYSWVLSFRAGVIWFLWEDSFGWGVVLVF